MNFLKLVISILFLSLFISTHAQDKKFKIHTLAFYNLENLFDTINDPIKFDDYSPIMELKTNRGEAYRRKITNMARVIAEIGKDVTHNTPAILGVCEVENKDVLENIVNDSTLLEKNYGIVHYDSPDSRGIDVALLYQKSLFMPISSSAYELKIYDFNGKFLKTAYGTPHNYFINQLLQTGIVGLIFMLRIFYLVHKIIKPKVKISKKAIIDYSLYITFILILVFNFFNVYLYGTPAYIGVTFFLMGLSVSHITLKYKT